MQPSESIDHLIATTPDWRGQALSRARAVILAVDPAVVEEWKYMGSPVWELDGPLVVGNVFKAKVKLGFAYGALLDDPDHLFNGELGGKQRRSYELAEGDALHEGGLEGLIRAAIAHNRSRRGPRRPTRP